MVSCCGITQADLRAENVFLGQNADSIFCVGKGASGLPKIDIYLTATKIYVGNETFVVGHAILFPRSCLSRLESFRQIGITEQTANKIY